MKQLSRWWLVVLYVACLLSGDNILTRPLRAARASDPEVWGGARNTAEDTIDGSSDGSYKSPDEEHSSAVDGSDSSAGAGETPQEYDQSAANGGPDDSAESDVPRTRTTTGSDDADDKNGAAASPEEQDQRKEEGEQDSNKVWGAGGSSQQHQQKDSVPKLDNDGSENVPTDDESDEEKIKEHDLLVFSNLTSKGEGKRGRWGAAAHAGHESSSGSVDSTAYHQFSADQHQHQHQHHHHHHNETSASAQHIPFVPGRHSNRSSTTSEDGNSSSSHHINPPEGFTITARVYIDKVDKLAHFDDDPSAVALPYFDCGAAGSTTAPLPVKHVYVRHSLSAPTSAFGTANGESTLHPVLAVALRAATLELSSGEALELQAGDTVLLEDGLRPGHILRPNSNKVVTFLFLTLPQTHHHIGKEHRSIPKLGPQQRGGGRAPGCPPDATTSNGPLPSSSNAIRFRHPPAQRIRRVLLGAVALSVSTLAADFLGRVAPLWLAVGVGGTCFVVGMTYGGTVLLEAAWTAVELWRERRQWDNNSNNKTQRESSSSEQQQQQQQPSIPATETLQQQQQ